MARVNHSFTAPWLACMLSCGARPRLRNILEEYPAGIGIFKEFLQNADDAGARKFAVVRACHASGGLRSAPHASLY